MIFMLHVFKIFETPLDRYSMHTLTHRLILAKKKKVFNKMTTT